jgi:hypothetical protein
MPNLIKTTLGTVGMFHTLSTLVVNRNQWLILLGKIHKSQNRLLKVCCVSAISASLSMVSFFFSFLFFCCSGHLQY